MNTGPGKYAAAGVPAALARVLAGLDGQAPEVWLERARGLVLAGDPESAAAILAQARSRFPFTPESWLAAAGVAALCGDRASAQALLREVLAREPGHVGASFELARVLSADGAWYAAGQVLRASFIDHPGDVPTTLRAARMLAEWGDKAAAVELAETAIAAGARDARLLLYTGALQGQLGKFAQARACHIAAIAADVQMLDFGAAYGLATLRRYDDPGDPDIALLHQWLALPALAPAARASLLFALGKVADDLGEFAKAAHYLREGNALVGSRGWSRKAWRRVVDARLGAQPLPDRDPGPREPVPVFIVGAPRSGTTLAAELLGRSPQVCNRGELDWLPHLAEEVAKAGKPDRDLLDSIAARYLARLQREDTATRWFIDKQPLNFMHLDLIRALFPQAAIIHCRRNSRDTALSIWSQHFESPEYRFAYDFADIGVVLQGCAKLLAMAARRPGARVFELRYEDLVRDPQALMDMLAAWLGIAPFDAGRAERAAAAIGTASLWQARQPVYTRSIGRWRAYAFCLPELLEFADD